MKIVRPTKKKSIGKAKAAAVVLACIVLTEAANFIPNDDNAWTWYLTTSELTKAALCLFLRPTWVRWSGVGIFLSQALDELTGGNYFGAGLWEYPLSAVFVLAVYLITRNHDSEGGK